MLRLLHHRRLLHITSAALATLAGCADASTQASHVPIVYGEDDRREPFEADSPLHAEIARSQVAVRIVDWAIDRSDPEAPQITYTRTLGESEGLCDGQPFAEQIAPGSCSATLIDTRHLLTAGHCVDDPDDCANGRSWVFGFHLESGGALAALDADDVYTCSRVVVSSAADDYAILELDRDVGGRAPVPVRLLEGGLRIGSRLRLIGFPNGVPAKVDGGGAVTESLAGEVFRGTVDAFDSSSGSGVFDDEGRLLGFLQAGRLDYVSSGDCAVVNRVESPGPGGAEVMAYPDRALNAYCAAPGVRSPICTCDGAPCVEASPDAGGEEADAGSAPDAGPALDSGSVAPDAAMTPSTAGCRAAAPSRKYVGPTPMALILMALVLVERRRRS